MATTSVTSVTSPTTCIVGVPTSTPAPASSSKHIPDGLECMVRNWHSTENCIIAPSWPKSSFAVHWIFALLLGMSIDAMNIAIKSYDKHVMRKRKTVSNTRVKSPPHDDPLHKEVGEKNPPRNEFGDEDDRRTRIPVIPRNVHSPAESYSSRASTSVPPNAVAPMGGVDGTNEEIAGQPENQTGKKPTQRTRRWKKFQVGAIRVILLTIQSILSTLTMLLTIYYNGETTICILIGAFAGHIISEVYSGAKSDKDGNDTG
ncbi:hypothetical protein F4779DRAFT_643153 [Xylariaceae sp. FL0662B]|nr:hypothetical protein F4779DRAFT_643153 [Xylariaceae sp. FL0662B]